MRNGIALRKNPISFDEAKALIESKRWPHPPVSTGESNVARIARETFNEGIDEALEALSRCSKLKFKRATRRKKPMSNVFYLPVPNRPRSAEESQTLDAATEWLLSELNEPASVVKLRAAAEKELKRPRDGVHRRWAECFLKETEEYT